ncbi:protocadherin alpha [Sarotherodon galilaeus]
MSKTERKAAEDMTEAMEATMQRLQQRFQSISEQLESKHILFFQPCFLPFQARFIHAMGTRINDLERNVTELMTQAGMEAQASSK